jgi:TM2 domain-containing membrane protein YozV
MNNFAMIDGKVLTMKSNGVAILLSIFFGTLGADRFYMGHFWLGILKLITFGGFFVWWFIDIFLMKGSVNSHNAKIILHNQNIAR